MPSPINSPMVVLATGITTAGATEVVAGTSAPCNPDNLETVVNLEAAFDVSNSASGTAITFRLRRTSVTGALVTLGSTWGPFSLTASLRNNFTIMAQDAPGACAGLIYVVTFQVTSNAAMFTVNTATIQAWPSAAS
jgi:hypothetical protein